MGPQGEEIVEATSLAARLGSAIVDIEVRHVKHPWYNTTHALLTVCSSDAILFLLVWAYVTNHAKFNQTTVT